MTFKSASFRRQTWALSKKTFTIIIFRSWFSTIIRAIVLPVLLVTLLAEIPNFTPPARKLGVGNPTAVQGLAQSMRDDKPLAIVQTEGLGPDVPDVLKRLTQPLNSNRVIYLDSSDDVNSACAVDLRGYSNCHAVVTFLDSPLSGRVNASWNYSIIADPSQSPVLIDVFDHNSPMEGFWLPLQSAIDNAITDTSVIPEAFSYAYGDQERYNREQKSEFLYLAVYILSFVFFASMATVSHHVSSMISSERESGMSQLVDAMGGDVACARVISYVITFDILYLPVWIILGCILWSLLVPTSSLAIVIFWQILTGWAVTSASVFASAFFTRSNLAAIAVPGLSFILAALASYVENLTPRAAFGEIAGLGFFFPSMNYVFFFDFLLYSEIAGEPANLGSWVSTRNLEDTFSKIELGGWVFHEAPGLLWGFLVIQIIFYPLLAVLVENILHGNNRRRRDFTSTIEAENSHIAIETTDLEKHYKPSIWARLFRCSRKPTIKAVNSLSLVSQKRQILCLLGPNGSGKTTTLDMIAGFQAPTAGSININALPSQLGVCPQKNVLFKNLTVYEHLVFWNTLKSGTDSPESLEALIATCDLTHKKNSLASRLSGGMKRKLQLACMLVGGSSVCLLDEVTSGLDPISRRVIWNAILEERSRRTMIFTTHFLDECEVLSDHIVILSLGKMRCQGTPAELKNQLGGGYRVHLPKTEDISNIHYPVADHGDRYVCTTPDSSSAAWLLSTLKDSEGSEHFITGPTIEDVFLRVSEEPHAPNEDNSDIDTVPSKPGSGSAEDPERIPTRRAIFSRQFKALFLKRVIILRSQWWIYLFAMAVPIICSHFIQAFLQGYQPPSCNNLTAKASPPYTVRVYSTRGLLVGPQSENTSIVDAIQMSLSGEQSTYAQQYPSPILQDTRDSFVQYITDNTETIYQGGLFVDNVTAPLLAVPANYGLVETALSLLNVANMARTGVPIHLSYGFLRSLVGYALNNTVFWTGVFCLLQGIYPAFFSLYPAYERRSQVRALQYSNGVRALPLWLSYMLFDFIFVVLVSTICTVLIMSQAPFWGLGYVWFVLVLYGVAAMLVSYIVSTFSRSQPAAFAWTMLINIVEFILSLITMVLVQGNLNGSPVVVDGTTYGLGLIFPIQNLLRAMTLSLNQYIVRCRGTQSIDNPGSIYAYGGPILLLIIQICAFFGILLWLDGTIFNFSRPKILQHDEEIAGLSGRPDVDAETARVETSQTDLLRMVHVSKKFGSKTAVEDVSLGLREGEILALLGPNGAGKTTSINMIRGDIHPSLGNIYLEGVNVQKNKRLAQENLGVCPQFDALDLLTTKEHLTFYARCKGVVDIQADVKYVMAKVGITAHADKHAAKLSGGNKRKLSLAIALLGNPPVLLLDEPSSAMDAVSKRGLWKTLEAVAPGRSVLITTHSMEEADAVATRAAIISKRLLAIGTTQELRKAHSNEYHIHMILRSAPMSSTMEMQRVANWVTETFYTCDVQFEGENLGGQVRFIVPADTKVPVSATRDRATEIYDHEDDIGDAVSPASNKKSSRLTQGGGKSFVRYLIETLEEEKEELGLDCYSIGAATMERVFLSVVKESDASEDEDEKTDVWRRLGWSR